MGCRRATPSTARKPLPYRRHPGYGALLVSEPGKDAEVQRNGKLHHDLDGEEPDGEQRRQR